MIYVSQIIMLYTLNLYSDLFQLHLKNGKKWNQLKMSSNSPYPQKQMLKHQRSDSFYTGKFF